MAASEESTLVDEYPIKSILNQISPWFIVDETKYGGRGCFAPKVIPQHTVIHLCQTPIGSTLSKPFKKEVCSQCYTYTYGETMKFKISKTEGKHVYSLFFCSEECKSTFTHQDINRVLVENLLAVEKNYLAGLSKPEIEPMEPKNFADDYVKKWDKVASWETKLESLKPSKRQNQIFRIDDNEYLEIKYVIGVLFNMYKVHCNDHIPHFDYPNLDKNEANKVELLLFDLLYSSEFEKVKRYPYLLYSYINIYKFIKLTCTPELQAFIDSTTIRSIIGKNLSNAFGIWSEVTDPSEDKEFLGFGVYPSASFFNHSCSPNIVKTRNNSEMVFTTSKDIEIGEELCISYGNYTDEPVELRQKQLKEWFFDCACTKCQTELKTT